MNWAISKSPVSQIMAVAFRCLIYMASVFLSSLGLAALNNESMRKDIEIPAPEGFVSGDLLIGKVLDGAAVFVPNAALAYLSQGKLKMVGEELTRRGTCSASVRGHEGRVSFIRLKNELRQYLSDVESIKSLNRDAVSNAEKKYPLIPKVLLNDLASSSVTVIKSEIHEPQHFFQYSYWRHFDDGGQLAITEVIFPFREQFIFLSCQNKNLSISLENTEKWRRRVFSKNEID